MTVTARSRVLRWAVPGLVVAAVAVTASGVFSADATPPLPSKTAAQLLVDVQKAHVDGLSGTVVQHADLGLPQLPGLGSQSDASSPISLLTGTHTVRVWAAGDTRQRLALVTTLGEQDVVRDGRNAWVWSSRQNTATHYRLPVSAAGSPHASPAPAESALTPQQAAARALRAVDPTTRVSIDGTGVVAGRSVYELVLAPKDGRSLIGQVRIAVDAQTSIPLRVQVFGRDSGSGAAAEVAFTRVSFSVPGAEQFRFTPPPGAKVSVKSVAEPEASQRKAGGRGSRPAPGDGKGTPRTVGTGWTTVVVADGVTLPTGAGASGGDASNSGSAQLSTVLRGLTRVSGSWGSGRLFTSKLLSALLTDDGRVLVGAVPPELLYSAAAR